MSKDTTFASETYDVSPKEREVIEWRAKRRMELRHQYLREIHNPHNTQGGYLFDPQLQRQYTANFSYEYLFRPTVKNWLMCKGLIAGSIFALIYVVKGQRDARELKYRTGQVSYRDRDFKFV